MFHVSALHWVPFSFSLEHFLNPSHPLLYQFPSPMSSQRAINFSCQYIALGSLQFFLRLHAKPLLPPIIPGFHPPVLPQAIHVSCQCIAPTSSLFTLSCMLLSLLILSPHTHIFSSSMMTLRCKSTLEKGEHGKHYHKLDDYCGSKKLFWPVEIPFSFSVSPLEDSLEMKTKLFVKRFCYFVTKKQKEFTMQ